MHAPGDSAPSSRSGLKRSRRGSTGTFTPPWPRVFAGGGFQLGIGLVLISLGRKAETDAERRKCYRLAAWFLLPAAGNFMGGLLDLTVARTAPPRT
jgi:hypothetical protein